MAGLAALERVVADACRRHDEWAAGVAAAIYAGIDFAIANPEVVQADPTALESTAEFAARYDAMIGRFTGLLQDGAPSGERRPASTDEALVAGVVGMVGDHLRLRRFERLAELRPELVLLVLLPYLGFADAQRWANRSESID